MRCDMRMGRTNPFAGQDWLQGAKLGWLSAY
jgi:hypothetical protein